MTTTLYRIFDRDDQLLYVGISDSVFVRLGRHADRADWAYWATKITLERYEDRRDAELAELEAIRTENPVWNRQGRPAEEYIRWMESYPADDPNRPTLETVRRRLQVNRP